MRRNEIGVGIKAGKLTAIRPWGKKKDYCPVWMFHCDCGNDKPMAINNISKSATSCGHCGTRPGDWGDKKSGAKYNKLRNVYNSMKQRCTNPRVDSYSNYGGRGVIVCEEWSKSYSAFKKWALDNGYDSELGIKEQSIDRINVNSSYNPNNCRWVNMKFQSANKRNTVKIDFHGEFITLMELSERSNFPYKTIKDRYYKGKRGDDLIAPSKPEKLYEVNGIMMTVREISDKFNLSKTIIRNRISRGKTGNDLIVPKR